MSRRAAGIPLFLPAFSEQGRILCAAQMEQAVGYGRNCNLRLVLPGGLLPAAVVLLLDRQPFLFVLFFEQLLIINVYDAQLKPQPFPGLLRPAVVSFASCEVK